MKRKKSVVATCIALREYVIAQTNAGRGQEAICRVRWQVDLQTRSGVITACIAKASVPYFEGTASQRIEREKMLKSALMGKQFRVWFWREDKSYWCRLVNQTAFDKLSETLVAPAMHVEPGGPMSCMP